MSDNNQKTDKPPTAIQPTDDKPSSAKSYTAKSYTAKPRVFEQTEKHDFSVENCLDENGVSIYIPFVFTYVTRQMVTEKMEEKFGTVNRVDVKFATNSKGQRHKKIYVHFKKNSWYQTDDAVESLKTLTNGEPLEVPWVDNWFWKLYISKSKRLDFIREDGENFNRDDRRDFNRDDRRNFNRDDRRNFNRDDRRKESIENK
jgi:hypothetical protein